MGRGAVSEMRKRKGDVKNIKFLYLNLFLESHKNSVSDFKKLEQGECLTTYLKLCLSDQIINYLHQNAK